MNAGHVFCFPDGRGNFQHNGCVQADFAQVEGDWLHKETQGCSLCGIMIHVPVDVDDVGIYKKIPFL